MLNTGFSPWPSFSEEEAAAVAAVIKSNKVNYWTGVECREFEKEFATWSESKHAIAVNNGTVALEVALYALGIGPGDEVIVTARSFFASASCIVARGAKPVFADIDFDSHNLSAETIRICITPKTKAIICVHLGGVPCDMGPIMSLANERGLFVIEDCAQAHGARYQGKAVGGIGHIGAWSFCQDKIMTTGGEGGMITTNDKTLWSRMWSYKDHGKSWSSVYEKQHPPGFRWVHDSFGTNGRMLEVQAAIGRIQLKRMPDWLAARTRNAGLLTDACAGVEGISVQKAGQGDIHAYYRFYASVDPDCLNPDWSRERIVERISALGVPCMQGSCAEMYLEKAFDNTDYRPEDRLPIAKKLGETSFAMLVHPTLTDAEMSQSCEAIRAVLSEAFR